MRGCGLPNSLTGILIRLGPSALVRLASAAHPLSGGITVTGLVGWTIPDLRIAVYGPRNTPGDGCLAPAGWRAGWLARRLTAPVHGQGFAETMKDPRRITPRYG